MHPDDDSVAYRRGEAHHSATITADVARAILHCWQARRTEYGIQTALARQFQVSPGLVHAIIHGKTWRVATHVRWAAPPRRDK
jgi:hypothetical protein